MNAATDTVQLANVAWADDRLADGKIHWYAWSTSGEHAERLASCVSDDRTAARVALYDALIKTLKLNHRRGATLVGFHGETLTPAG